MTTTRTTSTKPRTRRVKPEQEVTTSKRMPRQPTYLTRQQTGALRSDQAEYADLQKREAMATGGQDTAGRDTSHLSAWALSTPSERAQIMRTMVAAHKAGIIDREEARKALGFQPQRAAWANLLVWTWYLVRLVVPPLLALVAHLTVQIAVMAARTPQQRRQVKRAAARLAL